MSAKLEQRLVAALGDDNASADKLAALIGETEAAIISANNNAETAREAALDPTLTPDAATAHVATQTAILAGDRLRTLLARLNQRYQDARDAEYLAKWRVDAAALQVKRDALADELKKTYPVVTQQLADLLARIAINDQELWRLNQGRPAGIKLHLLGAELCARHLEGFNRDSPPIGRDLVLPDWVESNRALWPPREIPASVLLAESIAATKHGWIQPSPAKPNRDQSAESPG